MTLYVTKEILEACDCCAAGFVDFERQVQSKKIPYTEFLRKSFIGEKLNPGNNFVYFAMQLKKTPKFYLMQENFTMSDRYHVFNTFSGQHELYDTLDAALARRQELISERIRQLAIDFSIQREVAVGEDTMWIPIQDLPMDIPKNTEL